MRLSLDRDPALDPSAADWFAWLPVNEQASCREEMAALAASGLTPGELDYDAAWWGWRSTAEIYTDPELLARLRRPHPGDGGPVPRPTLG